MPPPEIHQPEWLWAEAFSISLAELSQVVPVREGYLFFVLSEVFKPTERQYEKAHINFLQTYKRIKGDELIEKYMKKLFEEVNIIDP